MNNEDFDIEEQLENAKNNWKDLPFPWYKKLILKLAPWMFMRMEMKKLNLDDKMIDYTYKLFGDKEVHIMPMTSGSRGFILCIDNKFTIWFYQDGDHFVLDGHESGDYSEWEKSVTVFDGK